MDTTPAARDKAELRPVLLAARRAVAGSRDREADARALAGHVVALAGELTLTSGSSVAAYEAMRTEPPTAATIDALVADGIRVLVPITLPDNDLDWCDVTDEHRMPLGPDAISAAGLVLAPGLSADARGTRLGRGGGSYDRALARTASGCPTLVVLHPGEARGAHEAPLPRDEHDVPVDGVLTVDGVTWF